MSRWPAATSTSTASRGGERTHEGKIYRPTYIPPSLHVALIALYVLTLIAGVALGAAVAILTK